MIKWFKALFSKEKKIDDKLFKEQMGKLSEGVEKEFSKIKSNNSEKPIENNLVPETHLSVLSWTVSCWRYFKEKKVKKGMPEKDMARFIRLFLIQEKKRGKIKDFNIADARVLNLLSLSCPLNEVDKLITEKGWTDEISKAFEKEIGYK